jgi:hypothetical protein
MDDLERWLRAQMQAATADPPLNLLPGVWRRRRTHLRRAGAGAVAALAAVAIAVPSVLASTTGGPRTRPAIAPAVAGPAPGSELLKCGSSSARGISGGELSWRWKPASIQAGSVWLVGARSGAWQSSKRLPDGRLRAVTGIIVAVRNGSTAEITTSQPARFRFMTREVAAAGYTLHDGVAGLTLAGCPYDRFPPGIPAAYAAGLTLFYLPLGYVTDLTGCLRMQVRTPPSWRVSWTATVPLDRTC